MKKYLVAKVTDDDVIYEAEAFYTVEGVNEYIILHKRMFPFDKLAIFELKSVIK